jgi:hypothetical protein
VPYLIDASNLGGLLGGSTGARDAAAVVRFLAPWARGRSGVTVVFDGCPRPELAERYGALEVVWSGGRSADEVLVELARRRRAATVVTGDRELARRCREAGARVMPAAVLAERVEHPHARDGRRARDHDKPPASAAERAHWRIVFGDSRAEEESGPPDEKDPAGGRGRKVVAPGEGFEPPTNRLTAGRSTTELPRKGSAQRRKPGS